MSFTEPPLSSEEQAALNSYVKAIVKTMEHAYSNLKGRIKAAEKELKERAEANKEATVPKDLLKLLKPLMKSAKKAASATDGIEKAYIKHNMNKTPYRKVKNADREGLCGARSVPDECRGLYRQIHVRCRNGIGHACVVDQEHVRGVSGTM